MYLIIISSMGEEQIYPPSHDYSILYIGAMKENTEILVSSSDYTFSMTLDYIYIIYRYSLSP